MTRFAASSDSWSRSADGAAEAQDEYDCLISPLMHQLHEGATEQDVARWLKSEMSDQFGLSPQVAGENRLASELVAWWINRTSAGSA
jgi:hypothetical protein